MFLNGRKLLGQIWMWCQDAWFLLYNNETHDVCVSLGNNSEVHTPLDSKLEPFLGDVFCFMCSTMIMSRILPHRSLFKKGPLSFRNREQCLFTLVSLQHHPTFWLHIQCTISQNVTWLEVHNCETAALSTLLIYFFLDYESVAPTIATVVPTPLQCKDCSSTQFFQHLHCSVRIVVAGT